MDETDAAELPPADEADKKYLSLLMKRPSCSEAQYGYPD